MTALTQQQIKAVMAKKTGHCTSCEHPKCPTPKRAKDSPEEGCGLWETPEANAIPELEIITVETLKDYEQRNNIVYK